MDRRRFIKDVSFAASAYCVLQGPASAQLNVVTDATDPIRSSSRPLPADRNFISPAVEQKIQDVSALIADPRLVHLFENCYPNTLDTTVQFSEHNSIPDTFVITGDIAAMWLRDSTAQVIPYLPLAGQDAHLQQMFRGLIHRQARSIQLDPYANAFYADARTGEFTSDQTTMLPGVHERKWEIDSLCYPIRLAWLYWKTTGDTLPFDTLWNAAARLIVETFRVQQRLTAPGPYRFARNTTSFYDNSPNHGLGNPTRKCGLLHSAFRPSDDTCLFPFLIPSNWMARTSLYQLAELANAALHDAELASSAHSLATQLDQALRRYGTAIHPRHGKILAYEVDGFGNALFMDDANSPSLLSLPYLGCCNASDPVYKATRSFLLASDNPFFVRGTAAEGIGGPHTGPGMVWPLSIILRAMTSKDDAEIAQCLRTLVAAHADFGFMHESFDANDPTRFTRPWFAWCNSLFGELVVQLAHTRPALLAAT